MSKVHQLYDEKSYYEIFARNTDDGCGGDHYSKADVLLLGVSCVGKTSICNELAKMRVKAANTAVVWHIEPDKELLRALVAHGRPVVLALFSHRDTIIRRRLETARWQSLQISRADLINYITLDIMAVQHLVRDIKCQCIDITCCTPEQAAQKILCFLSPRRPAPELTCISPPEKLAEQDNVLTDQPRLVFSRPSGSNCGQHRPPTSQSSWAVRASRQGDLVVPSLRRYGTSLRTALSPA